MTRFRADRPLGLAPATVRDYRELARRRLPRQLFDYVDGGAYEERTMRANVADLEALPLRQLVMRDVSERDPWVEVLGERLALPVILGPVGLAGMLAPRAEAQAARAAEAAGVPFVEFDRLDLPNRGGRGRHLATALVPALRNARPRLHRAPDGARAGGRVRGAGADR